MDFEETRADQAEEKSSEDKQEPALQDKVIEPPPRKKRTARRWVTGILIAVIIVLLLLLLKQCGYIPWPEQPPKMIVAGDLFPGVNPELQDDMLNGMTLEELLAQMQKIADASNFSIEINGKPVFKNGKSKGTLGIKNPEDNAYPIVVQILLDETKEVIYDSGGMLPGQQIMQAKLLKEFSKGEYTATAYFNLYDPSTQVWLGKSAVGLLITIEE